MRTPVLPTVNRREDPQLEGWYRFTFVFLLILGAALLLYKFPAVPIGLHQDEMSEAYESYALLHTAADRWGYHLPIYFLSWGSGQNVLQAYLNVPFVAVMGLTRWSARLLPMLLNLLCLPLFFLAVRRWYGLRPALLALAFLALSPWHIMLSRWGIENSPLPFFLALGLWTFGRALDSRSPYRIVPSLLPFVLAMYTYGVVVIMVPIFVVLLLWLDPQAIRRSLRAWIAALGLFAFFSLPLALFTVKNYVLKRNFVFDRALPFSVPLLPRSRLAEVHADPGASSTVHHNLKFFAFQLADNHPGFMHVMPWYQLPDVHPLQTVIYLLFWIAFGLLLWRSIRARQPLEPFVPWLLACCLIVKSVPLNCSRAGVMFLPMLALGSYGFFALYDRLPARRFQQAAWAVLAVLVLWPMVRFSREYYGPAYASEIAESFYPHMPAAVAKAEQIAGPVTPIYFSQSILLNYVDLLFIDKVDPVIFQHSGAAWSSPDFGQFHFNEDSLQRIGHPFVYVAPTWQKQPICPSPEPRSDLGELIVGVCP